MTKLGFKRFVLPVLAFIGKGLNFINLRTKSPRTYYIRAREQLKKGKTVHGSLFIVFGIIGQEFLKRKLLLASLVILVVLLPLVMFVLRGARSTEAAWYNDNWQYRQTVTISNTGSVLTNYQIGFSINSSSLISAGKMKSACQDIRVTDINGKILQYALDSGTCNTTTTYVWTNLSTVPTGQSVIYVYYGNPSASDNQNPNGVFDLYDDFHTSTLDTNKWTLQNSAGGTYTQGNNQMSFSVSGASDYIWIHSNATFPFPVFVETSVGTTQSGNTTLRLGESTGTTLKAGGNYYNNYSMDWASLSERIVGDSISSGFGVTSLSSTFPSNQIWTFAWLANSNQKAYYNYTQTLSGTDATNTIANYYMYLGLASGSTGQITVKWTRVRKAATTLPTISSPSNEEKSNGPLAYWKFDEGYGTILYDSTLGANTAAMGSGNSAPTWVTEDLCMSGKCLKFDGVTSYVQSSVLSTNIGGTGNFSFSAWVKTSSKPTAGNYNTISMTTETGQGSATFDKGLEINSSGYAGLYVYTGATNNTYGTTDITDSKWHHVTATYDGTNARIYVDGNLQATNAVSSTYTFTNPKYVFSFSNSTWKNFPGLIDEPKIYGYARTAAQIKADYVAGLAHAGSVKGINAALGASRDNNAALSQGLVGYWKADESSGNLIDSSGNGLTGTVTGTSVYPGKFGNSRNFNGSSDFSDMSNNSAFNITNKITVSAWINPTNVAQNGGILSKWTTGAGTNNSYILLLGQDAANNKFGFYIQQADGTTKSLLSTSTLTAGVWTHIVGVADGANMHLYKNGVEEPTNTTYDGTINVTTKKLLAGKVREEDSIYSYNGSIDEARVYNRALSGAEVQFLYNWAPGPVGYWNFDEGTGSSVNDISGSTNTGSWNGTGSHWTNGKFGKAGNFALSTADYVTTNTAVASSSNVSVSMWVYPTTTSTDSYLFDASPSGNNFTLIWYPTNSFYKGFAARFSGSGGNWAVSPSVATANTWHHIEGTSDGTTVRLYVDGVGIGTTNYTSDYTPSKFYIGSNIIGTGNFNGLIDEVKLYNYARNQKQVIEDMNGGHPLGGSPVGSQIGYWRFDEGYGLTTYDASPQQINGTLNNFASPATSTSGWTTNGKFNKALMFDGTNDYVSFATSPAQNPTVALSITSWIKTTGGAGTYRTIISKPVGVSWAAPYAVYNLRLSSSNKLEFWINDGGVPSNYVTSASTIPADSTWHYVAATYDGAVERIYIDGIQNAQNSLVTTINGSTQPLVVGTHNAAANSENWFGSLDEVKMYNSALTADDIKIDYNRGSALVLGAISTDAGGSMPDNSAGRGFCPPGDTTSCNPPIALWSFDEGSGTIVQDVSGNSYPGSWAGTSSHYVPGKIGKAGNFGGSVPADAVTVTGGVALNSAFTLEAWINPQPFPVSTEWPILFRCKWVSTSGTCNYGFALYNNAGTYQFYNHVHQDPLPCNNWLGFLGPTWGGTFGAWNHVVMTFSGGTYTFYLNGVNKGTVTTTNSLCQTTNDTTIGKGTDTSTGTYSYVTGQIDQVMIYNYARTGAQVAWDYNRGGAQINYRFDEGQGTTLNDSSGNGLNGVISIGTTGSQTAPGNAVTADTTSAWYNGRVGKSNYSLNFDGTDDYARTTPINTVPSGSYSLSAWVKPGSAGGVVVSELGTSTPNSGWHDSQMEVETSGVVKTCLWSGSLTCVIAGTISSFNTWNHVVLTYNASTTTLSGYLNGQKGTSTTATKQNPTTGVVYYSIGAADSTNGGNGSYFTGQVDEFRVFNYPLTNIQVLTDYNQGAANFAPLTGSP